MSPAPRHFFQEPLHNRKSRINRANTSLRFLPPSFRAPRLCHLDSEPSPRSFDKAMLGNLDDSELLRSGTQNVARTLRYQLACRSNRYRTGSKFASCVSDNPRCLFGIIKYLSYIVFVALSDSKPIFRRMSLLCSLEIVIKIVWLGVAPRDDELAKVELPCTLETFHFPLGNTKGIITRARPACFNIYGAVGGTDRTA